MAQRDPQAKREAILDAALAEMAERGLHSATTDVIASRAGVGAGTVFRIFSSKDELIRAVFDHIKIQATERLFSTPFQRERHQETLERIWTTNARLLLEHRAEALFLEQFYGSSYAATADANATAFASSLQAVLQAAIAANVVRKMPPDVFEALFFSPARHLARLHHRAGFNVTPSVLAITLAGCWRAVAS